MKNGERLKKAQIKMKTFWLIENDRKRVLNEDENFFIHREVELQIELKKKKKTTKSIIAKFPRIHHTFQESLPVFPWLQSHSKGNHHLHLLLHIQWRPIEFPSREVEWETLQTQSSKYNGQSPLSRRQDNDGGFEAGHGRDLITLNFKT